MRRAEIVLAVVLALVLVGMPSSGSPGRGSAAAYGPLPPLRAASVASPPTAPRAAQPSVLLQRVWGGPGLDTADAVAADAQGNTYVAGETASYGPGSPACAGVSILKYSGLGNLLMQRVWYNGSYTLSGGIAVDASGNIYFTAQVGQQCPGGYYYGALVKLDANGSLVWERVLQPGFNDDTFNAVAVDPAGFVYVTGMMYNGPAGLTDAVLLKFDPTAGNPIWERSWGGSNGEYATGLTTDRSGNVYVVGSTYSYTSLGSAAFLLKVDPSGNLLYRKVIGDGNEAGDGVAVDAIGNVYLAGATYSSSPDALLLKFDATGGLAWERAWGSYNGTELATAVGVDASGDPEIAGRTDGYGSGGTSAACLSVCQDAFILRISSTGSLLSQVVFGDPGVDDNANGVVDAFGVATVVGSAGGAPPYALATGNTTLAVPALALVTTGNASLGGPGLTVGAMSGGAVYTLTGNESYAGSVDNFLIKYGEPLVRFSTTGAAGASIVFNGTSYTDGQSTSAGLANVTVTASPSPGSSFDGWTTSGGVRVSDPTSPTTRATVIGSGNLSARFVPDTVPPSVAITSPSNGSILPSASATVSGTASDNGLVQKVELSVDGSPWVRALGTTSWTANLTLHGGVNRITARATDAAGNMENGTVSVTVALATTPDPSALLTGFGAGLLVGIAVTGAALYLVRWRQRSRKAPPAA